MLADTIRPPGGNRALQEIEGRPVGAGRRVAVVVARFNSEVTERLLDGALSALRGAGVADEDLLVVRVPGAFELPIAAKTVIETRQVDAVVALGAVIRGETDHYDYVCEAAREGLLRVGLETAVPVLFGVLTCDSDEQAAARAGGAHGNKGADVALDALRMADLTDLLHEEDAGEDHGEPDEGGACGRAGGCP
jgi:6,7-dimethyl-8-ribityllumazine synthase